MGKNYYLSKGNLKVKFENIRLTEIFTDMKSLEKIDFYTAKFNDYDEFRSDLLNKGLINYNDDVVIGNFETDKETKEKKLVPLFHRKLIFSSDLEKIGFKGKDYKEISTEIKECVFEEFNNLHFMKYIIDNYYEKYINSKKKTVAPISSDVRILYRIINNKIYQNVFFDKLIAVFIYDKDLTDEIKKIYKVVTNKGMSDREYRKLIFMIRDSSLNYEEKQSLETKANTILFYTHEHDDKNYLVSFRNLFMNEIFKCEVIKEKICLEGIFEKEIDIFKPMNNKINVKGIHDLLCLLINYNNKYLLKYAEKIKKQVEEKEEFLENRDFDRPLIEYAKQNGLDLTDKEAIEQDDYANSFIIDQQKLVKKYDGME